MSKSLELDRSTLVDVARTVMPFGRYRGRSLLDLPEAYLVWLQNNGWPRGKLGAQLALALEIKHNGLADLVARAVRSVS
jgi:uncharacterized protein (DUF3820 family)